MTTHFDNTDRRADTDHLADTGGARPACHAEDAAPLLSEADKVHRIRTLLAPAQHRAQLWVLFLDDQGYQAPLMMPIEDHPPLPDVTLVDNLLSALAGHVLGRAAEPPPPDGAEPSVPRQRRVQMDQVLFVLERTGPFGTTDGDQCWAAALAGACARAGVRNAGTFLLSRGGVVAVGA